MKIVVALLSLLLLGSAAEARTVHDHDGHTVEVPEKPQRIVSLHDWTLTVMARELGAPLVGSTGRLAADGSYFIRGARELFGLDFSQVALASVHGQPDLERIRSLKPDLILANTGDYGDLRSQLTTIAPTLMYNPESGRSPFELYAELAGWLGRQERFDELKAGYERHLAHLRTLLASSPPPPSYAAILTNPKDGTIEVLSQYGALTTALDDLGFTRAPIMATVPVGTDRMRVGAESIGEIDMDFIFTSYLPETGSSEQSVLSDLHRIAPGYQSFLKAHASGHIISLSRYEIYPASFKGLDLVLSRIEPPLKAWAN